MDYDKVKKTIWVIRVTDHGCKDPSHSYLGGVSIGKNCILSCAHGITDTCTVSGRRLYEKGFVHQLETLYARENWELRMLKCKNEPVDEEYAKLSDDEKVGVGEKVYHIGLPKGLTGSYFTSRVSSPCIKVEPSTFSDSRVCGEHFIDYEGGSTYLTMSHSVNMDRFELECVENMEFKKKLHPMVPVIGCGGMGAKIGCFGGPLFRENGEVLGIATHHDNGFVFSVHVSALKAFITEAKSNDENVCSGNNNIQKTEGPEESQNSFASPTFSPSLEMKTIWVIQVTEPNGYACWSPHITYLAGVSVDKNRILTCDNIGPFITEMCTVKGRRLHGDEFFHELETVHVRQNWGLWLFKCKEEPVGDFECGKFSDDEKLYCSDKVSHFGHPRGLVGSYYSGYASYPCTESVNPLSFSDSWVCKDRRVSKDDMFEKVPPPYRTTGDFLNVGTFSEGDSPEAEFYRKLHPMLPFVQCAGIPVETGSFGGPLYRENGDILGIVTHNYGGFCMAVHVSALKAFMAEAKSKDEKGGAKRLEESTSLLS